MIDFLKESTFAVKDVIQSARVVLKKYYFSIVGLCIILFLIPIFSTELAGVMSEVNPLLKLLLLVVFVLSYLGCQLTIIKYIFHALDKEENDVSYIKATPTTKEVINFFLGSLCFFVCCVLILAIVFLIFFPIIYTGIAIETVVQFGKSISTLVIFIASIRISFFPFFIIDRHVQPLRALRLSLAITRGNFIKLFLLLSFFGIFHALYFFLESDALLGFTVLFINSFFIIPLSSVALAIAYRDMMGDYTGDSDPDVMDNII